MIGQPKTQSLLVMISLEVNCNRSKILRLHFVPICPVPEQLHLNPSSSSNSQVPPFSQYEVQFSETDLKINK